jgi:xanthine dehydrogenase small subunit
MSAYFRPTTLEDALTIRAGRPVTVLAGGTDIYPARTARRAWGDMRDTDILDISALPGLRGVGESEMGFRLGALTTWTELAHAKLPPAFAGLQAAAHEIGGRQIQNRGTLAGNLCTASPAADGVPCLLTLEAEIELASRNGLRRLPLSSFFEGYRHTLCGSDEIVTAILVAGPDADAGGAFLKLGARRYLVISIAMAAAVITADPAGTVTEARVAVGACSPVAQRLPALERALIGRPLADAGSIVCAEHLQALAPIDDIRASGDYRRAAALTLLRDLLAGFAERDRRAA